MPPCMQGPNYLPVQPSIRMVMMCMMASLITCCCIPGLEQERVRVLSEHDVQAVMTHTGLCRCGDAEVSTKHCRIKAGFLHVTCTCHTGSYPPDHVISSMSGCAAVLACRDAAAVALNVQGSSTKALQWAKDVLSNGSCIADAAAKCWMTMLEDAGISRSIQQMIFPT